MTIASEEVSRCTVSDNSATLTEDLPVAVTAAAVGHYRSTDSQSLIASSMILIPSCYWVVVDLRQRCSLLQRMMFSSAIAA